MGWLTKRDAIGLGVGLLFAAGVVLALFAGAFVALERLSPYPPSNGTYFLGDF